MKPKIAILIIVALFLNSVAALANTNVFKIWDDGTAFVKGEVEGNISRCERDAECSLILKVNEQKVLLVYNQGESVCKNQQAAMWVKWGKNVKNGMIVKAYGLCKRNLDIYSLYFCDSKDYFILGPNDTLPGGESVKYAHF